MDNITLSDKLDTIVNTFDKNSLGWLIHLPQLKQSTIILDVRGLGMIMT